VSRKDKLLGLLSFSSAFVSLGLLDLPVILLIFSLLHQPSSFWWLDVPDLLTWWLSLHRILLTGPSPIPTLDVLGTGNRCPNGLLRIILHGCWSRVPIMVLWSSSLLVMLWRVLSYVATEAVVAWHSAQVGICVIVGFWWKKTPEVLTDVCYILFGVRLCCLVLSPVTIFQACTGLFRAGWSAAVQPKRLIKNVVLESYCHILFLQSYIFSDISIPLTASHLSTGSGC